MEMLQVRFLHPDTNASITMELPRDTRFSALTPLLYQQKFVEPQKPGYRFLYREHLCGMEHTLGDYIPASAQEIELKVFGLPVIMV